VHVLPRPHPLVQCDDPGVDGPEESPLYKPQGLRGRENTPFYEGPEVGGMLYTATYENMPLYIAAYCYSNIYIYIDVLKHTTSPSTW